MSVVRFREESPIWDSSSLCILPPVELVMIFEHLTEVTHESYVSGYHPGRCARFRARNRTSHREDRVCISPYSRWLMKDAINCREHRRIVADVIYRTRRRWTLTRWSRVRNWPDQQVVCNIRKWADENAVSAFQMRPTSASSSLSISRLGAQVREMVRGPWGVSRDLNSRDFARA